MPRVRQSGMSGRPRVTDASLGSDRELSPPTSRMDAPVCGSPFGGIPRPLYRVRSVVPIRRELWIYFLNGARGRRLKLRRRFVSAAPVGRRARLPIRRSLPRNQSGPWPQHVLPTSKRACTTSSVKLSPPAAHRRTAQIRISGRSDPLSLIPFGVLHSAARVITGGVALPSHPRALARPTPGWAFLLLAESGRRCGLPNPRGRRRASGRCLRRGPAAIIAAAPPFGKTRKRSVPTSRPLARQHDR